MNRRTFLTLGVGGLGAVAGCSSLGDESSPSTSPTSTDNTSTTPPQTQSQSEPVTKTETAPPEGDSRTIYVSPDGADNNPGTRDAPVRVIRHAVKDAMPGDTVYLLPGQYFQQVGTKRPGEPDAPITITGPPEAVVSGPKGEEYSNAFSISHSYCHLTGITIDGLQDPSRRDDPMSYARSGIHVRPRKDEYVKGLVIKPS